MNKNIHWYYQTKVNLILENFKKNGIEGFFFETKEETKSKVLSLLPEGSSIGMAGSVTLREIGVIDAIMQGKWKVCNQYLPELSKEESLRIRKEGTLADYFLSGTNAITWKGELINISGMGNKIAGLCYAKNVIIVAGVNKIVRDVEEGLNRVRHLVAPINCKRLDLNTPCKTTSFCDYDACRYPQYKRSCNQTLITEGEWEPGRIKVILVGEFLGF